MLAVSGGSDSMAMLRLAHEWRNAGPELPSFTVLTVDHGLRPEAADEARHVKAWAVGLGLSHVTLAWEGPRPSAGLQAKAREARYDLMAGWCEAHGGDVLLTAHTLDDQAETVLMRLARTTSFDSLAGIPRHGHWKNLPLYRPLLDTRRQALRNYLEGLGQAWIDDPSNADPRFERVRIRQALAELAGAGIDAERLAALAAACATTAQAFEAMAGEWIECRLGAYDRGACHIDVSGFLAQPEEVRIRILGRLVQHFGGASAKPERAELERLATWVEGDGPGCTLGGAIVVRKGKSLLIAREPGRIDPAPVRVPASGAVVWDRRFAVTAPPGSEVMPAGLVPGHRSTHAVPDVVRRGEPAVRLPDGTIRAVAYDPKPPVHASFLPIGHV